MKGEKDVVALFQSEKLHFRVRKPNLWSTAVHGAFSTIIQTGLLETQLHIKHCIRVSHGNLMFCVPAANKMVETLADDAAKDV